MRSCHGFSRRKGPGSGGEIFRWSAAPTFAADVTNHNRVVVLGTTVVTNLFGSQNPIGQTVKVSGVNFTVVGVLKLKGSNGFQDQDDVVLAPLATVQELITGQTAGLDQIVLEAKSSGQVNAVAAEATWAFCLRGLGG